jgi:hypothetical protein
VLYTGSPATVVSTKFSPQTYQIRVSTNIANGVYISVTDSTAVTIASTTGAYVAANSFPEYFVTNPGQVLCINSTSTSSGVISVTEMTN